MQALFSFIKSRQFFINLILILLLIFLIFFSVIKWLSAYTEHGEFVTVPDFKGQTINNLPAFVKNKQVGYQIIDSIYDPKEKTGIVLRQDPDANHQVKHNRTVYLYVTGMIAPAVKMPKLVDRSERQAKLIISTYGLKVGKSTEKKADCSGCVLAQLFDGKEIKEGTTIKKGSKIDLVIGQKDSYFGGSNDTIQIPDADPIN
jgi:beta-lactam-binding protein with PASTA domain